PKAEAVVAGRSPGMPLYLVRKVLTAALYFSTWPTVARISAALIRSWPTSTPPTISPMITSTMESSIRVNPASLRPAISINSFDVRHGATVPIIRWESQQTVNEAVAEEQGRQLHARRHAAGLRFC